jgi:NAD(P)-dependent dehydrogenase (short-subunit alcohol dehydrogenase family)
VTADSRVALVTGGTRGLGRAVTAKLARSGVPVAAAFAHDCDAAKAVQDACESSGATVTLHQADVGDPASCQGLVEEVLDRHGRLDYLVNNAGMVVERRYGDVSVDDWQRHLAVNLSSAFYLTQAALGHMTTHGFGRIVNIGSVSAVMGSPVQIPYAAAKAGIIGLTRSTARGSR